METFKLSDRAELEMWQDLQRRFKISMGGDESELAKTHTNAFARAGSGSANSVFSKLNWSC